ncbi:MAG: LEA type 2 family protein [Pedobacter sp.]|nr:LEA type 2 family protein [Chitinophagaceae bacterium]
MKKSRLFALLLPILMMLTITQSCKKPQGFEYRDLKNVQVQQLGFDKTNLTIDLVYFNPNNFGVDLKRVDCDVYIDKNYLGSYKLDTTMHIDKRSEFTLPSTMAVNTQGIFKNALTVLLSNEVLVTVKGTTRVGKAGIYITVPFNYEARHKMKFF